MANKSIWTDIKKKFKISTTRKLNSLKELYATPESCIAAFDKDPYDFLVNTLEKPFKQADILALTYHPELKTSLERCKWICFDTLKKNEAEGHTKMSASDMAKVIWKDYREVKDKIFEAATTCPMFHYDVDTKDISFVWTYKNESRIADEIKYRLDNPNKLNIDWEKYTVVDGFALTDEQKQILRLVCEQNVVMLNGSAGTGKTSAMKALVNMVENEGYTCTILAPTGIAAKRISEVTGHSASTIHKFIANTKSYMGDFLIIDEMSMVGVSLLGNLFMNLPNETKIVFVCDEAQLASISCGNIVQDIIDSKVVPIVNLTKVFRYGIGGIATVATDVRMGRKISKDVDFNDYNFVPVSNKPLDDILRVYSALREQYNEDEIMILSPFNVRESGTYAINKAISDKYNNNPVVCTRKVGNEEVSFKIGDRIVNTENNYHMAGENFFDIAVMNGEIGHIKDYDGYTMTVDYGCGRAFLENADVYKQLLAYSITVHKSQGSQAKAVVVIADKSHGFFLTRNLIYVALSRAQEKLIFIGDIDTVNNSLKVEENKIRNTSLKEMLIK